MKNESDQQKPAETESTAVSFYDKAAWYVLAIPFVMVIVGYLGLVLTSSSWTPRSLTYPIQQIIYEGALLIELINLILATIVFFKFDHHKKNYTAIVAMLGGVVSGAAGVLTFICWGISNMGRNC